MKKIILGAFSLVALFVACSKEQPTDVSKEGAIVLSALSEETKASLSSTSWLWSSGDQIGIIIRRTDDKSSWYQQMNLKSSSAGKTNGVFETPSGFGYASTMCWDIAAVYPYSGNEIIKYSSDSYNLVNISLPSSYSYSSREVNMPLAAKMSGGTTQPTTIQFKHVAAVIKVSLKDVPVGTNSVTLSADKDIVGNCNIDIANIGTSALSAPYGGSGGKSITISFTALTKKQDMVFYFPVLPVTSPTLTLSLTNDSGDVYWEKTATSQASIGRGEMLDMATLTVPATKLFKIGVINYQSEYPIGDLTVHYWYGEGSGAGDATISSASTTESHSLGTSYWSNAAQTFNIYHANIPITAMKIRMHKGDDYNSYDNFGGDRNYSPETYCIFEYGGTFHYDFH